MVAALAAFIQSTAENRLKPVDERAQLAWVKTTFRLEFVHRVAQFLHIAMYQTNVRKNKQS